MKTDHEITIELQRKEIERMTAIVDRSEGVLREIRMRCAEKISELELKHSIAIHVYETTITKQADELAALRKLEVAPVDPRERTFGEETPPVGMVIEWRNPGYSDWTPKRWNADSSAHPDNRWRPVTLPPALPIPSESAAVPKPCGKCAELEKSIAYLESRVAGLQELYDNTSKSAAEKHGKFAELQAEIERQRIVIGQLMVSDKQSRLAGVPQGERYEGFAFGIGDGYVTFTPQHIAGHDVPATLTIHRDRQPEPERKVWLPELVEGCETTYEWPDGSVVTQLSTELWVACPVNGTGIIPHQSTKELAAKQLFDSKCGPWHPQPVAAEPRPQPVVKHSAFFGLPPSEETQFWIDVAAADREMKKSQPPAPAAESFSDLEFLIADQSSWSQATFGTDQERGPVGALRHLAREATEAAEQPDDIMEYADCLLLILDASRRSGFGFAKVVKAAIEKMKVNKAREWPKPTSDQPVEHVKESVPAAETDGERIDVMFWVHEYGNQRWAKHEAEAEKVFRKIEAELKSRDDEIGRLNQVLNETRQALANSQTDLHNERAALAAELSEISADHHRRCEAARDMANILFEAGFGRPGLGTKLSDMVREAAELRVALATQREREHVAWLLSSPRKTLADAIQNNKIWYFQETADEWVKYNCPDAGAIRVIIR